MKYKFWCYDIYGNEQIEELEATKDKYAILKLFDKVGVCEFACLKENGKYFTDDDCEEEKKIILSGC